MLLYHFTSREAAAIILRDGISKGDVPTSPVGGFNAPWLTTDDRATTQAWTAGSRYDKAAIRLTVHIDDDDSRLVRWTDLAVTLGVEDWWLKALDHAGGGGSLNWYVYLGTIPVTNITYVRGVLSANEATG